MTRSDIHDFAARFDISDDECDRIAEASATFDDFNRIWEDETWWRDEKAK